MKKLLSEIVKEVTPTKKEHAAELEIVRKIIDLLKAYDVKPILVGSLEKGTDLSGNKDIDVFMKFPPSVGREELEKKALAIGKTVFKKLKSKYEIDYAEHPYVKGFYSGYDVEIVPCYDGGKIISSVDRTPLHTKYVKKKIKASKKFHGDIRLLKQFMKGRGVYGAEAKVEGFSGYLVELLVIHYKSFASVLKAASQWSIPEIIDVEKQWDDPASLKYLFTQACLIVIDPVDKNRNVAAAVSKEKLSKFIISSEEFLKKPAREFFFPKDTKPKTTKELAKKIGGRRTKFLALVLKHKKLNENTLYSQLKKTIKSMADEVECKEFKVFNHTYWTNELDTSIIMLEMEVWSLPDIRHHQGPPVDMDPENQEKFLAKYSKEKPYMKDGRWVVDTERIVKDAKKLLPTIIEERKGFGKNLREVKNITILEDEEILEVRDAGWHKHLTEYLR